ncbi:IQ-domain-containing protein [Trifolium medium]|uniref:IQ-domain-containing protein n=1 Tax=Trifolium medium TaxID=97028 RepID=A0A392NUK1_9FABA|nr:IQ-domain-containing protein [Trifolium medium]
MAPTESAKARLRGQGSPRFATDVLDKNSFTRRHSLSSSINSKSGSFSPRAEKLITLSGRGVARTDKSLSSSRDKSLSSSRDGTVYDKTAGLQKIMNESSNLAPAI